MIIRIQGEGQYRFDDSGLAEINKLDNALGEALDGGPEAFAAALTALENAVREHGTPLADDDLVSSDVILPPSDASLDEIRAMLDDDGLIPG